MPNIESPRLDTSHRSEDETCTGVAVDVPAAGAPSADASAAAIMTASATTHPSVIAHTARRRFFTLLRAALAERTFARLVLSKPLAADGAPVRVAVRELELRGARGLSFVHSHPTRDVTQNLSF
ncbi:MAG: hypothetical protein ACREXI_15760, partial [Caldimonas sp.]